MLYTDVRSERGEKVGVIEYASRVSASDKHPLLRENRSLACLREEASCDTAALNQEDMEDAIDRLDGRDLHGNRVRLYKVPFAILLTFHQSATPRISSTVGSLVGAMIRS